MYPLHGKQFCSLLLFYVICLQQVKSDGRYAVLSAKSFSEETDFCIYYYSEFSVLPSEKSKAVRHTLQDYSKENFCYEHYIDFKDDIILLSRSNSCDPIVQAHFLQEHGAVAALFILAEKEENAFNFNISEVNVNITVGLISLNSVMHLHEMMGNSSNISVYMFSPVGFRFDFSLLIIWIIAMTAIAIGGYWSGIIRNSLYLKEISKSQSELDNRNNANEVIQSTSNKSTRTSEESSLNISSYTVAIFVILMMITLLLMYFFYDYLVYLLIGLFVIVSITSLYSGLHPLVMKIFPPSFIIGNYHLFNKSYVLDYRHFLLAVVSLTLPIFWACTRKKYYSWILQDVLGIFFCINLLKAIRLPNLKVCFVLLVLLFFYDIFFVFITPFFTAKGESIMEKVATGGKSEETFPMTIRVPHLTIDALTICYGQFPLYSVLGFGDILVPGLLIAFCCAFDLMINKARIYFYLTLSCYGLGLLITFLGLYLMHSAQPALLYLVPATLLPLIIVSYKRGDLKMLWNGFKALPTPAATCTSIQNSVSNNTSCAEASGSANSEIITVDANSVNNDTPLKASVDQSSERRHLL